MRSLTGKVAIVTGGSRGIGPYLARALGREGVHVVLAARTTVDLEKVAARLRAGGSRVLAVTCDVTSSADRQELIRAALAEFGAIDILVNNAGIEATTAYESQDPDEIAHILDVNLVAPMLLTRAVLPGMVERGSGFIVNMASLAGKVGTAYSAPYSASKAGLILFTESIRAEFGARNVSATAVCPGFVSAAGMYDVMTREAGVTVSRLLGTSTPTKVAAATIKAIKHDRPEVIVNPGPMRPISALAELAPRLAERVLPVFGANRLLKQLAERHAREHRSGS